MPKGHNKRSAEVTKCVLFLLEHHLIDAKRWPPNNGGFYYISIIEKGKQFVRNILHDAHTRECLSISGITLSVFDDYKNSLPLLLSPEQQVSVEQKDGNLFPELDYPIISQHA
jgi:hypothetical protein